MGEYIDKAGIYVKIKFCPDASRPRLSGCGWSRSGFRPERAEQKEPRVLVRVGSISLEKAFLTVQEIFYDGGFGIILGKSTNQMKPQLSE